MGVLGVLAVYPAFQVKWAVDDSLDAFPCHGVSGIVGTLLTGVFAEDGGLLYGGGVRLLTSQCIAAVAVMVYAGIMTAIIFCALRGLMRTRVGKGLELAGLDAALHGETAYNFASESPKHGGIAREGTAEESTWEGSSEDEEDARV
eukprot:SRR837773.1531.p1 GENE.SRR837773.1531~~SRR837773.1531.p1  ORF type:complete len:146 (-),score=43.28 SRR837773.1531:31-468(-)